ncbi:FecR family protein [uncultured Parabacteroides sp.]|uniref:FecR family protein n=1 Tax=uncultured Parabacteroides sp. TaxID=512312 RepID=UPI00260827AB|nr:FecR family protein [uncultured Parabacteroides sp.]
MEFNYALLAKYLVGNLSSEEMEEVMRWRDLSTENETVFSEVFRLRLSWNAAKYADNERIDRALEKINARINRTRRYGTVRSLLKYAAVILLLVSFSSVGWNYFKPETYMTIALGDSEGVKKVALDDGSVVWLRGNSVLKIPQSFSVVNRTVSLQGEAFFDIAKNAKSLFIVATDYVKVEVHGTSFNVNVDAANKTVETILVRGSISLQTLNGKNILEMNPGERVTFSLNENTCFTEHVDVNVCATWRFNQLVFENTTLREIANQLSIKYNVNVNIESSKLAQRRFRCVINEDERLPDVLEQLCYLAPITYRIENSEIYISEKQTKKCMSMGN